MSQQNKKSFADHCLDLAEKATAGPWSPCLGSGNIECTAIHFEGNDKYPLGLFVCDLVPDYLLEDKYKNDLKFKESNMEFIAHAREDVPELAKRLKKATAYIRGVSERVGLNPDQIKLSEDIARLANELEAMPEGDS